MGFTVQDGSSALVTLGPLPPLTAEEGEHVCFMRSLGPRALRSCTMLTGAHLSVSFGPKVFVLTLCRHASRFPLGRNIYVGRGVIFNTSIHWEPVFLCGMIKDLS